MARNKRKYYLSRADMLLAVAQLKAEKDSKTISATYRSVLSKAIRSLEDLNGYWERDGRDYNTFALFALCPACGENVYRKGETKDGRLILSCGDAVTSDSYFSEE